MNSSWELEWAIGPVQSFVAAARRTRDLWGGSYLLSLLVAETVAAVVDLPATRFLLPSQRVLEEDPLVVVCRSRRDGTSAPEALPRYAGLPNHVRLTVEPGQATAVATAMTAAARSLWDELAEGVWRSFVAPAGAGPATRAIWERQVQSCWEISWTAGPEGSGLLARRKLWRSHLLPAEPGDRCMVQPEWQELSGELSSTGRAARERQSRFWAALRARTGDLDLRTDERLSAPVLVKRLWTRIRPSPLPVLPDVQRWASTYQLAVAPWMEDALREQRPLADDLVRALPGVRRGEESLLLRRSLEGLAGHDLARLDPELLFDDETARARAPEVLPLLHQLYVVLGPPSRFFAVVLADGDRLGRAAREVGAGPVSAAIARFAGSVRELAGTHHAVVVYAGGDDVLAFAPVRGALAFVEELARAYDDAFRCEGIPGATLSAAVVFAHARDQLTTTLHAARALLEDVSKEQNGRGSVAASVRAPGGESARWVRAFTWKAARSIPALAQLVRALTTSGTAVAESALRRAGTTVERLLAPVPAGPGEWGALVLDQPELLAQLVAADLAHSGVGNDTPGDHDRLAAQLLELMAFAPGPEHPFVAQVEQGRDEGGVGRFGLDLLPLLRFLATEGRGDT